MSSRGERNKRRLDGPVYSPESLGEALQILRKNPTLQIWSGGTWLVHEESNNTTQELLALHRVRELQRVVRNDIQVEVGAGVPLERLLAVSRRFLPQLIIDGIHQIGPPPIRNAATMGGAVCIPGIILPITACLQMLDTRVELRRQGNGRWISLNQLRETSGAVRIAPGEIVTRFRIPLHTWTHWHLHSFGRPYPRDEESLSIIGAATLDKSGISEFRFVIVIDGTIQIRLREAEIDLVGRSVPFTERERRNVIAVLENNPYFGTELSDIGRWRAANSLREFLHKLG